MPLVATPDTITVKELVPCSIYTGMSLRQSLHTWGKTTLHDDSSYSTAFQLCIQSNESISQRQATCQQEWQEPRLWLPGGLAVKNCNAGAEGNRDSILGQKIP